MLRTCRSWAMCFCAGLAVLTAPTLSYSSSITFTFPAGADSTTQARATVNTNVGGTTDTEVGGTSASASASGFGNTSTVSIDMLAGELKSDATSVYGFDTLAVGWEFLTFSGDGTINYAFDVEGSLSNLNATGLVGVTASINFYDVTTWTNATGSPYFYDSFGTLVASPDGSGASPFPYRVSNDFDSQGVQGTAATGLRTCASQFIDNCTVNSSGTTIPVDLLLSGSLNVEAGSLYLLELILNTYTINGSVNGTQTQIADFANTATFSFASLNGLTFATSSGQFLNEETQDLAAVPEPASLLLLGTGIVGIAVAARRRRTQ